MKNKIITYSNLSRFLITLIVLISSVVISSCSVFSPIATVDIHKFQITLDNNSNIQNSVCTKDSNLNHNNIPENKLVLQLMPIKANAPYDTVRMYYSKSKYELDNYLYNEWVTPPQNMLTQLVLQELLNSCIYGNVINSSFLVNADYRLSIQILELKHIVMQDLDTKNSNTQNANNANKVSIKILVQYRSWN